MTFQVAYVPYDRVKQIAGFMIAGMSIGTGGNATAIQLAKAQNQPVQYSCPFQETIKPTTSVVTPIEYLNRIEQVLQVSVSDLAKMLGVSRQAIYKWKNGESIGLESAHKLEQLALAADVFIESGTEITPFMLRRTVKNNQNFLELVQQGNSAVEAAQILVHLIQIGKQETAAIDAYLATKKNRRTDSIISEFPLPFEDD
jgi:transcriptional regulator with XRE-family HTH domain